MASAEYTGLNGQPILVQYDPAAPCRICKLPVVAASMGGTDVCSWCDIGIHRNGTRWTYREAVYGLDKKEKDESIRF